MSLLSQQAATRSAARQKKKTSPPPPETLPPDPEGVIKTSPRGNQYRLTIIPLMDLPGFLEKKRLEAREFFHYRPEEDKTIPENNEENRRRRYLSGFVLGVRPRDSEESLEL